MRILFFVFQFIVWIIAISIKDYKNHYLWDNLEFQPIHNISYPPINKLYDNSLSFDTLESTFSINESDGYSKKCFENFFIPNDKECPITDIIVENRNQIPHTVSGWAYDRHGRDSGTCRERLVSDHKKKQPVVV